MNKRTVKFVTQTIRLKGLGANINAQIASTLIQLLSVPVYLHFWSLARYGEWLIYSAIPAYLSLADIGVTATATNLVTSYMAQGRRTLAARQLQSAAKFSTIVYFYISILILFVMLVGRLFGLFTLTDTIVIALLSFCLMLNLFSATIDICYRASGKLALGINILTLGRMIEWLGGIAGLVISSSFEAVACGMCLARALFLIVHLAHSRSAIVCPRIGVRHASLQLIKSSKSASLGFFFMPIIYAIQIQGVLLLIGTFISAEAVGAFAATRTYTRVSSQLSAVICRTLWPRLTILWATNEYKSFRKVVLTGVYFIFTGSLLILTAQYFLRNIVNKYWSVGKLEGNTSMLSYLLASCFFGNLAQMPSTALLATNQHISYTANLAAFTVFGALVYVVSFSYFGIGAVGPAIAAVEFVLLLVALKSFSAAARKHLYD